MSGPVLALAGGVGGAKLAWGLAQVLPPEKLVIVVNTGDDATFNGLHVSPDLDTVMYTLAGMANPETGWGIAGDTAHVLEMLARYGAPTWFRLGDRDMALHIRRTELLGQGLTLSQVTQQICQRLGVQHQVVPMSDGTVRTLVATDEGEMPMQVYFVQRRCEPQVRSITFAGAEKAKASPGFDAALDEAGALVFCPSNPYLSIDPILAIPGVRQRIASFRGPRVVVSPIVAGQALKGPLAKMMAELSEESTCVTIGRHYVGLCDLLLIDEADRSSAADIERLGLRVETAPIVMSGPEHKVRLAQRIREMVGA
ncbi:MAG: 2-phospho-L-lactate transferase [Dehalococcoidia bacterium]